MVPSFSELDEFKYLRIFSLSSLFKFFFSYFRISQNLELIINFLKKHIASHQIFIKANVANAVVAEYAQKSDHISSIK